MASAPSDTEPPEDEESQEILNVQSLQHDKLLQVTTHFHDNQFTHPPLASTTPEPKLYAYISGIGVIEGYVPPLPPPLPVTVREYVDEPGVTAETQLAIWSTFPLINYLPVDKTCITCWKQEERTMLSKFCDDIISVHCLLPHLFDTLGNL
jgi:hypothetical protein